MDQLLSSLGGLLLEAIPTFLLVIILHFYLKRMYFGPMAKVLAARYEATEGARKVAEESLAKASAKTAEYENALRAARAEIYRDQEEFRKKLRDDQAAAVRQARERSQTIVREAQARLAGELEAAKRSVAAQTDSLANAIVESVLHRRVS